MSKPSVGRIVHYNEEASQCLAAIVCAVNPDGDVNLAYFAEFGGQRSTDYVDESEAPQQGRWHWPERVE